MPNSVLQPKKRDANGVYIENGSNGKPSLLGNGIVGILRETCNKWERRAPLAPSHCAQLLHATGSSGIKRIIVQPCNKRIYNGIQYENVGCEISEDLSECGLIVGVKQPKVGTLLPDRAYSFFSHTHKAQPQNMPLLDEILSKRISLYDYERIVGDKGERLVAFGEYAGRAGMIDFLRGLGQRYLSLGYSTPFLSVGSSFMYTSLSAAKSAVLQAGDEIRTNGLPCEISPLVFVFTGNGNVSRGAQEVFRLLPHTFVDPSELPALLNRSSGQQKYNVESGSMYKKSCTFLVYGCVVTAEHMVAPNDPAQKFDKENYYAHPEHYHSIFHEKIAPHASVIVNCIYWESRYPRLITNHQLRDVLESYNRLIGVADISCDLGGSIECVQYTTSSEKPFYRYDPCSNTYSDDMDGKGIVILATDNLPTELPKESTNHFGEALLPFIPNLVKSCSLQDLLLPVREACIAHKGQLTSLYEYINRMRCDSSTVQNGEAKPSSEYKTMVSLDGHLFDHLLINEALDVIENSGGQFRLASCDLGQSIDATSHAELEVIADSEEKLSHLVDLLDSIAHQSHQGKPTLNGTKSSSPSKVAKQVNNNEVSKSVNVLILGAGRMCEPAVNYLAYHGLGPDHTDVYVQVIVGSLFLKDAVNVTRGIPNTFAVQVDVSNKDEMLSLVSKASVVISLLPANCHAKVAECCIEARKHLVTASYVSQEISALHDKAVKVGVSFLCEMGLDPGIDHMMAMKMINTAHLHGASVESFVSYCGGLPAPASADNPLGYKFSWNPAGALKAGRNPAVYKNDNQIVHVAGDKLFSSATRFRIQSLPAFALERLPNRDSLEYGDAYGISQEASTIFRATLRYEGFSDIMNTLASLGYLNTDTFSTKKPSFRSLFEEILETYKENHNIPYSGPLKNDPQVLLTLGCCGTTTSAQRATECIRYLELDSEDEIPESCQSAFDVLCSRMEQKLIFASNEQDMVLLHHEIKLKFPNGRPSERHVATLLEFGDVGVGTRDPYKKPQSAMARTVGLPAAIGAQLLLLGKITSRGVIRPLSPEIYIPALEILESCGVHLKEEIHHL